MIALWFLLVCGGLGIYLLYAGHCNTAALCYFVAGVCWERLYH